MRVEHSGPARQRMPSGVLVHCWDVDHDKKVSTCVNMVKTGPSGWWLPEPATIL